MAAQDTIRPQELLEVKGLEKKPKGGGKNLTLPPYKWPHIRFKSVSDHNLVSELLDSVKNKLRDRNASTMVKEEPKNIIPRDIGGGMHLQEGTTQETLPNSYR